MSLLLIQNNKDKKNKKQKSLSPKFTNYQRHFDSTIVTAS